MTFDGRLGRVGVPALSELKAGLHKAVVFPEGEAALAQRTPTSTFGTQFA